MVKLGVRGVSSFTRALPVRYKTRSLALLAILLTPKCVKVLGLVLVCFASDSGVFVRTEA